MRVPNVIAHFGHNTVNDAIVREPQSLTVKSRIDDARISSEVTAYEPIRGRRIRPLARSN
jgi:hypothetical protein